MDLSRRPVTDSGSTEPDSPDGGSRKFRPYRNGLPERVNYSYRGRSYPWAERAIEAAEAEHGKPKPVCLECGSPLGYFGGFGRCPNRCPGVRGARSERR